MKNWHRYETVERILGLKSWIANTEFNFSNTSVLFLSTGEAGTITYPLKTRAKYWIMIKKAQVKILFYKLMLKV